MTYKCTLCIMSNTMNEIETAYMHPICIITIYITICIITKGLFKRMQHCPTLLDQQCWTIVGQRVQTDATISQQLLAVQLAQNSVRK